MATEVTNVSTLSVDELEDIFSESLAGEVIVPEEPKAPSVLDLADEPDFGMAGTEPEPPVETPTVVETPKPEDVTDNTLAEGLQEQEPEIPAEPEVNPMVNYYQKKIEAGKMFTFDDYDPEKQSLTEYLSSLSDEDLTQLEEANESNKAEELSQRVSQEFYDSLPQELQYAYQYVANGGTDIKGLLSVLSQTQEVQDLNPESDAKSIVEQYLSATKFGDEAEIKEQIAEWEDSEKLSEKAEKFKPKLQAMKQQIVEQQIAQQEADRQRRAVEAQKYAASVQSTLSAQELGGVKLDKKTQDKLYLGLIQPSYKTADGRPTNMLGHLLDKNQKENLPLLAEALWLLSDPEDYRKKQREIGKDKATTETIRKLKTEQSNKKSASNITTSRPKTLSRPGSMFKR